MQHPPHPSRGRREKNEPILYVYNRSIVEVSMSNYIRVSSTVAGILILAACAARTADIKPRAETSASVAPNPACLTQTGSRIAGNDAHCSAIGRSYSNEDIDRTGATTAGEALRLLDPALTVHH
jgi:hypothetical protein